MTISANAEALRAEAGTSRYTKWAIALFFVALFIPGSFYVGVRMTPYRLYLIVMALPMVLRFRSDPTLRITAVDVLVFLAVFWRSLSILVNHQLAELVNATALFIELFFGYLLGRVFIRSASDYRFFFQCFLGVLVAFLPFALVETVTHIRALRRLAGLVLLQPPEIVDGPQMRFGFLRAQLSFDHALLYGAFCGIGFANMYYLFRFPRNLVFAAFTGFMALLAISSSSILTIALQVCLIVYERVLRPFRQKWVLLVVGAAVLWFSFEAIFGKTIVEYVVTELVINQAGAEGRLDQIRYGSLEIYRNPFFGIGQNPAALPFWRGDVFDNFWLHTAVRAGVPALLFIAAAFLTHFLKITLSRTVRPEDVPARTGYAIAFVGMTVIIGGLSIWGVLMVFIMVYFGAGAWLYNPQTAAPARRRPGAAAPAPRVRPAAPAPRRPVAPRGSAERLRRGKGAS